MEVATAAVDANRMMNQVNVRVMEAEDGPAVLRIYEKGMETRNATFETSAPTWEEWNRNHLAHGRFVAVIDEQVVGWAALSAYSKRAVYRGVAEVSVYIDPAVTGKAIGSKLMDCIIHEAKERGFWMLQSGIFPENEASMALHKKFGFREVGYREKIGQLDGIWRDVVLFEKRF
ncbi:GNAT family N-acetyltransferase [Ornithinibacillus contaminans]|uniref:GNAT family N-acetyltransferase n=1 Tax=Ornithinibacillus contaminans TaxID=694055 RepID=UPI0022A965FC|nr:GNAT family N-acetyltransferase [Ornithinibacillus contaminans]